MGRQFVVIKTFKDLEDNDHIYEGGDFYPREGFELDEARAEILASSDNKQKQPLIVEVLVKENPKQEDEDTGYPNHTGGGYYELSNGEKVQGKDAAIEAEKALKK